MPEQVGNTPPTLALAQPLGASRLRTRNREDFVKPAQDAGACIVVQNSVASKSMTSMVAIAAFVHDRWGPNVAPWHLNLECPATIGGMVFLLARGRGIPVI